MVPPDSDRISRGRPYSGVSLINSVFRVQGSHLLWLAFPRHSAKRCRLNVWSYNPIRISPVVWALPTSLAATMGISYRFLLLCLLRCVNSAGLASNGLCIPPLIIQHYLYWVPPFGYPRIKALSSSPRLFAGLRVLLRLLIPRHPPTALNSLIY